MPAQKYDYELIARLAAEGWTVPEIAEQIGMKHHGNLYPILARMGVNAHLIRKPRRIAEPARMRGRPKGLVKKMECRLKWSPAAIDWLLKHRADIEFTANNPQAEKF